MYYLHWKFSQNWDNYEGIFLHTAFYSVFQSSLSSYLSDVTGRSICAELLAVYLERNDDIFQKETVSVIWSLSSFLCPCNYTSHLAKSEAETSTRVAEWKSPCPWGRCWRSPQPCTPWISYYMRQYFGMQLNFLLFEAQVTKILNKRALQLTSMLKIANDFFA